MSGPSNVHANDSTHSTDTNADLSLGSFSSQPPVTKFTRKSSAAGSSKGTTLTLRDQEKHIDSLKKENFSIKLRVHFLEERLAQLAPDQIDAALKQNINLKIEVQQRGMELKKLKKLVLELERELGRFQRGDQGTVERDGELELRNAALEEELENARALLEENMDEIERLRESMEHRNDERADRVHQSRPTLMEDPEEMEAVEADLNSLRDKLAAVTIELQQKDDELEEKNREVEELVAEHHRIVEVVEQEWRGEVEEARNQVSDALAHLEREVEDKDTEIESANRAIEKLSHQVYVLEDENDRLKEHVDRIKDEEAEERERLEALSNALREKVASLKDQLQEATELSEAYNEQIEDHRARQEELAEHVENLVAEVQQERAAHEQAQSQLDDLAQSHRDDVELKETELQDALDNLSRTQSLLSQRESELDELQNTLQNLEVESKKAGDTHATARFSLQLETDRLKRDLERLQEELTRMQKSADDRENTNREHGHSIQKLHAENRDLSSQLAMQTQARLNISEKLDTVQASLKVAELELATCRPKVTDLEQRLSKEQRSALTAESQYRDQLTERNTLLLTIYQYMDRILGTPGGQADLKPFTNFSVFHDNLITRLKALSQLQLDFDKRCKAADARLTDRLNEMKKQLDHRWKQIDKFEESLKACVEAKAAWRKKLGAKEGELEAVKAINSELTTHLSSVKRPGQSDAMEIRALTARAVNAERRLTNTQNQLATCEEKIAAMNQKTATADSKWEARVKEYESRLKTAEERIKRERQGGKERIGELENSIKSLQRQLDHAKERNQLLNDVIVDVDNVSP